MPAPVRAAGRRRKSTNILGEHMSSLLLLLKDDSPALDLSFTGGSLPAGCSFARASDGTYYNSSGILTTASTGAPRFDHDPVTRAPRGILIEPQRENSYTKSNTFSVPSYFYNNNTQTLDAATGIEGTQNARLWAAKSIYGAHGGEEDWPRISVTTGVVYTTSLHLKAAGYRYAKVALGGTPFSYGEIIVDLQNGAVLSSGGSLLDYSVLPAGNGFYRATLTKAATATTTARAWSVGYGPNSNMSNYTGDDASGVYLTQVQIEEGSMPTSLIETTGSAVTRAADQLSLTIPSGVNKLRYTFDDNSTQDVSVSPGAYTVPTGLDRAWVKRIEGV